MKKLTKSSPFPMRNPVLEQTLVLLGLSNEFRSDVLALRLAVGIPKEGLPFEPTRASMRANQFFSKKLVKRTDEYFARPDVLRKIKALKREYSLSQITSEEYEYRLNQIQRNAPLNAIRFGVQDLLKKYNLPNSYRDVMRNFVMHNTRSSAANNYTIETVGGSMDPRDVCIRVMGPMTTRERKEAMNQAVSLFTDMYPQFSPRSNTRRSFAQDIRVLEAWTKRNDLKLKNSESMGEYVWQDDESTPLEELAYASKKGALRYRQALHRLREHFKKRFGRELV